MPPAATRRDRLPGPSWTGPASMPGADRAITTYIIVGSPARTEQGISPTPGTLVAAQPGSPGEFTFPLLIPRGYPGGPPWMTRCPREVVQERYERLDRPLVRGDHLSEEPRKLGPGRLVESWWRREGRQGRRHSRMSGRGAPGKTACPLHPGARQPRGRRHRHRDRHPGCPATTLRSHAVPLSAGRTRAGRTPGRPPRIPGPATAAPAPAPARQAELHVPLALPVLPARGGGTSRAGSLYPEKHRRRKAAILWGA